MKILFKSVIFILMILVSSQVCCEEKATIYSKGQIFISDEDDFTQHNLPDYGLKDSYNFKYVKIPNNIENYDRISCAVMNLEKSKRINSFHFIIKKEILLYLSTDNWEENEPAIKRILKENKLSDYLEETDTLEQLHYGDKIGVILCYNNLEFNSKLILALIDTQKHTRRDISWLLWDLWPHYLYAQYGIFDLSEVEVLFKNALGRLQIYLDEARNKYTEENLRKIENNVSYLLNVEGQRI